jgi:hypothetical protein
MAQGQMSLWTRWPRAATMGTLLNDLSEQRRARRRQGRGMHSMCKVATAAGRGVLWSPWSHPAERTGRRHQGREEQGRHGPGGSLRNDSEGVVINGEAVFSDLWSFSQNLNFT